MNYIALYVMYDESLRCGCGKIIRGEHVYLINYKENTSLTAGVRCEDCFKKQQRELDVVNAVTLLTGVLGQ